MKNIKKPKYQINFMFIVISLICLQLSSCASYKKFFAANNHDYTNVRSSNEISMENKEFPLNYTDRYSIPSIPKQSSETKIKDFSPPNYSNHTEPNTLPPQDSNAKQLEQLEEEKIKFDQED